MPSSSPCEALRTPCGPSVRTIGEMPNRSTSYYMCSFDLTNLKTREVAWSRAYEVKTAR